MKFFKLVLDSFFKTKILLKQVKPFPLPKSYIVIAILLLDELDKAISTWDCETFIFFLPLFLSILNLL